MIKLIVLVLENGEEFFVYSLILTTGTFLGGKIFIGKENYSAGRIGDKSSINLSKKFVH